MISIAELYDLVFGSVALVAGAVWCVYAWRSIGRSFDEARDSYLLFPAFLAVGNQIAILGINHSRHSLEQGGALGDNQLIGSMVTLWRALAYVGLEFLLPMVVVLWVISLAPWLISIRTWWTTADADGAWEGVTYGTRMRRRWRIEYYEYLLVRQVKAYSRVQPGRARSITVERTFNPLEASTTLRITPLVNVPLDVDTQRPFAALRWSSSVRHQTTDAMTELHVQWDLAAIDAEPQGQGRTTRVPARWDRRAIAAAGVLVVLAVVLTASRPWPGAESVSAGSPAALQQALSYAGNLPEPAAPRPSAQSWADQQGPASTWAVDEVDLRPPSHSDLCPGPAWGAITPSQHCVDITTFTPGHPITITALGVDPYGVLGARAARMVVWEFDGNPATKVVQPVGLSQAWQVTRLKAPVTSTMVTATVVAAAEGVPTSDSAFQPMTAGGSYRLIGFPGPAAPQPAITRPEQTH